MDARKSYVFQSKDVRASKRRRLVTEDDLSTSLGLRKEQYEKQWNKVEQNINSALSTTNASIVSELSSFLAQQASAAECAEKLRVGLVSTTYGSISSTSLFQETLVKELRENVGFACLEAAECQNLRLLLKALIQKVTKTQNNDEEGLQDSSNRPKVSRLLNYDLRLLQQWCQARGAGHVVVAFPEGEALDSNLLGTLISQLHSWRDRIRFTVLLGISSSLEIFSNRLPRSALRLVEARSFSITKSHIVLDKVFKACFMDGNSKLYLGPSLTDALIIRQREHVTGTESFVQALKYAHMCHFFGNPLTVFLCDDVDTDELKPAHFEAFRSLPCFKQQAESLLQEGNFTLVKELLDSDVRLHKYIQNQIGASRAKLSWTFGALNAIAALQQDVGLSQSSFADLYTHALSDQLKKSRIIRELMIRIKVSPSDILERTLTRVRDTIMTMPPLNIDISPDTFGDLINQLTNLPNEIGVNHKGPPSQENRSSDAMEAKVPRQRANLRPQNKRLSSLDKERESLFQSCYDSIEDFFKQSLDQIKDIFPSEILLYDLKAPHREAFTPKTRFAIERALSMPQDYLGCSCCVDAKEGLSRTQPPTSILYQLYLESGSLINVHDLFSAFQAILSEQYSDEQLVKALFFRSLAELKTMGFIKHSRKRVDHVAKLAWKGL